jgi:peptide/nickel transport system ATP-binding protein
MNPALVSLDGVSLSYRRGRDRVVALRNVSLRIARGETVGVIGPSGAGKSSLARVLLGLTPPDAGRRTVCDPAVRLHAVFQDPASSLNPHLEVRRILAEPILARSAPRASAMTGATIAALEAVGLDASFLVRRPDEMSGGEQQRVALARALLAEPDILVLDEAFSALDAPVRNAMAHRVADLRDQRRLTLAVIAHDLLDVRRIADRLVVLLHGRIVEEGPTGPVTTSPAHPMTRALVEATHGHLDPPLAGDRLVSDAPGCPIRHWCPRAVASCERVPAPTPVDGGRSVACWNP